MHRDLKPENILFKSKKTGSEVVLVDFGLAQLITSHRKDFLVVKCGTPG